MGYTSDIMSPTVANINALITDFGKLVKMFQDDVGTLEAITGALISNEKKNPQFQGPPAIKLNSMVQKYQTLLNTHAFDRLQHFSQVCQTYQQAIDHACATFDHKYPHGFSPFIDYTFANYGYVVSSVPNDLPNGNGDVSDALSSSSSRYMQQFQTQNPNFPPNMMYEVQDDISAGSHDLINWANALDTAFTQWQNALNGVDTKDVDIFSFTYDNGYGKQVSMLFNTGYEQTITNDFNHEDPGGVSGIESVSPEEYQQMLQTYPDQRTQRLMKILMSTQTGRKFAQYYIYMGQKLGPNFISWDHLGNGGAGAKSTDGGFVVMNLDDSMKTHDDYLQLAGLLVHEGVESYFAGAMGIRQMDRRHADYVAEWYQGEFLQEAGASQDYVNGQPRGWRAYQMTYNDWWQKQLDIDKQGQSQNPPTHNIYIDENTNVNIYSNSQSGIDRPGTYWPGLGGQGIGSTIQDIGGNLDMGITNVSGIPNPMGLDPRMLVSNNLNGPLPPLPQAPPPTTPHGW